MKITKERTTSAAALIDVIYITSDGAALPPAVKKTHADRPKPMESTATPDCREQAKAFLEAVRNNNYQQARAAMTGDFQAQAGNQDLARFRRSLTDFGQYQYVSDTCTRETGDISEAILVLQNNRGQTIMVQFAFINDRIDQCIARWGVQ